MTADWRKAERSAIDHGCRQLRPVHCGQNRCLVACRRGRRVVVKLRRTMHRYRHDKELCWLRYGTERGWLTPPVLHAWSGEGGHGIVLPMFGPTRPWSPQKWRDALRGLHAAVAPEGRGPLRADGRPRWIDCASAIAWYGEHAIALRRKDLLPRVEAFLNAPAVLVHGDPHRGNMVGGRLIDWENVAAMHPWWDVAALALADGRPAAAWAEAWDIQADDPLWTGALACVAIEAAAHRGPRHHGARAWLADIRSG